MLDSPVEEIKARLDIVDVLSEYIRLIPAGINNFKAICPFHREKTPSFMVSKDKQIWHCFGACGEGGDIFSFVMKMEGVEFAEALRLLAQKAGVTLKKQDPTLINQRTRLLDLSVLAARYYHKVLLDSPQSQTARDYFKMRGISDETVKEFRLGYVPDYSNAISQFLLKNNFREEEIVAAGLAFKANDGRLVDRFRDRLMFPLMDVHSNVVGFTGRLLKERKDVGKYINTPQTLIYDKSKVLYGLDKAKQAIKNAGYVIIVEGQMDVLASHQAGVKNVVAASGTALTLEQLTLLKRYTNKLILSFDMDEAGQTAAQRGISLALNQGMEIKLITLKDFKDPDECIKKDVNLWLEAIKNAKPLMDYYFDRVLSQYDLNKPEDKSQAAQTLLKVIAQVNDTIKQGHYLQRLAQQLDINENILREKLKALVKKDDSTVKNEQPGPIKQNREVVLIERLLALVVKSPVHIDYLVNNLRTEMVAIGQLQDLYKHLIIYYTNNTGQTLDNKASFNYQDFKDFLTAQNEMLATQLDILSLLADKEFSEFSEETTKKELLRIISFLKEEYILKEKKRISRLMRQAEEAKQADKIQALVKEYNQLLNGF
ncbi:MAG: DNA primase [bacterium]